MTSPRLSLFFFGADARADAPAQYRTLLEAARLADDAGYAAVWVPERHFQRYGGLYANPSVTAAALAVTTRRIGIRAGSVVLPIQNPIRVAEEWAMVDNLSGGRVGMAIATGWHVDDFVLSPGSYADRGVDVAQKLAVLQRLWRGEQVTLPNGAGVAVPVTSLPRPIQPELPLWLTTSTDAGFQRAGTLGHGVLTANFTHGHDPRALAQRIALYRRACGQAEVSGVTLMVHAFVGGSDAVAEIARPAMRRYITASLEAQRALGTARAHPLEPRHDPFLDHLVELQAGANLEGALSFVGTLDRCREQARAFAALGVAEVACLVDFDVSADHLLRTVRALAELAG